MQKLQQYVTTVQRESGHVVRQLAITSGRWWVIFTRPYDTFAVAGQVSTANIRVFEGREVVERSDDISINSRSKISFAIRRSDSAKSIVGYADRADIVRLYHALWIARRKDGAHFDAYPANQSVPVRYP